MSHALNLPGPQFVIDPTRAQRNIRRMLEKARANQCQLRPHFKTHQSLEVAQWFRDEGIDRCTVSSPAMAQQFAAGGWQDITIAFPAQPGAITVYNELAANTQLGLIGDSIDLLESLGAGLTAPVNFWIEVDAGYGRTGVAWNDSEKISTLAQLAEHLENIQFSGVLTHTGNSYTCTGDDAIHAVASDTMQRLEAAKETASHAIDRAILSSYGDTPTCSRCDHFPNIDELRPGNFVYYDLTQHGIGSCALDDIAVTLACPVVGIYPERNHIVVHGGAVHLSKDRLTDGSYGRVLTNSQDRDLVPNARVVSISQEHGTIKAPSDWIQTVTLGQTLHILPVHSCLTADCMKA